MIKHPMAKLLNIDLLMAKLSIIKPPMAKLMIAEPPTSKFSITEFGWLPMAEPQMASNG